MINETKTIDRKQNSTSSMKDINSSQSWNMTQNRFLIFTFSDREPPNVTLVSPSDNAITKNANVTFICNVTDDTGLKNISLYLGKEITKTLYFRNNGAFANVTNDTAIENTTAGANHGSDTGISVDADDPAGSGNHSHALIKFTNIFGNNNDQIPLGAKINLATLTIYVFSLGTEIRFFRLNSNWNESEANWTSNFSGSAWLVKGAYPNDADTSYYSSLAPGTADQFYPIDLTKHVQNWSDALPNYGVLIWPTGNDGVDFNSSDAGLARRPELTVTFETETEWKANQTKSISGTANSTQFNVTLEDNSTYKWNCLAYDSVGNSDWGDSNFTFIINSSYNLPPEVILQYPPHNNPNTERNVTLNVTVIDPEGSAMNVTYFGREKNDTDWTLVALPDTQHYSRAYLYIYKNQTTWIKTNKSVENIIFTSHEGDIVNTPTITAEWNNANESMIILDNDNISYGLAPGNHDVDPCCDSPGGNTDNYNNYFSVSRFDWRPWWGGNIDRNDNNYMLFSAGGVDYIIIHIEYKANGTNTVQRQPVYNWMNNILETYPNKSAIITTHEFLNAQGQRTAFAQDLWDNVIKTHSNVFLVLSGHVHAEGNLTSLNDAGKPVHQLLANYQDWLDSPPNNPLYQKSGFLRRMKFIPSQNKIEVKTYSPYFNQTQCTDANEYHSTVWRSDGCYENDTNSEFTLTYSPFNQIGQHLNVANSTNAIFTWKDRKPSTTYEWYVEVVDSKGAKINSSVWNFTTGA